jgi:SAM-dependent methyltransferase
MMPASPCRFCGADVSAVVADLGMQPLSNSYIAPDQLDRMEPFYPLLALVCETCFLVQLRSYESPSEIFSDYAYFSSYSTSWLAHCRAYVEKVIPNLGLDSDSRVVEIASNDGYLLQYFVERGIPVTGVEPAANVAEVARGRGIPTVVEFFGEATSKRLREDGGPVDLLIGNNVLAHVPDLNDFVAGLAGLLADRGTVTMEFPHLLQLIELRQFDTIYHEHFSYFSLLTVRQVFAAHGLRVQEVEELDTHGGSLRVWVVNEADPRLTTERVEQLETRERLAGLADLATYLAFAERVQGEKREIVRFFHDAKQQGLRVAGYGAPAKGNTLLNYCGIGRDVVDFTVDMNPHKQGLFLPGTHIPILSPDVLEAAPPDLVFILPWNLRREVEQQLAPLRERGVRFVARSPDLTTS